MTHYSFDADYAALYGLDEAVLIHNLQFWIKKNMANKKHFHEYRTWTYNSVEAFTELFPFWTRRQIERVIKSLTDKEIILKGNFSDKKSDRTNWYAFVDEDLFIKEKQHTTKRGNANHQTGECKPPNGGNDNTKTGNLYKDTKTNNKTVKGEGAPKKYDKCYYISLCKRREGNQPLSKDEKTYCLEYEKELQKAAGISDKGQENDSTPPTVPLERNKKMLEFLALMKVGLGDPSFNSWFKDLRYEKIEGKIIIIKAKTRFIGEYANNHWYSQIEYNIERCFPGAKGFRFQY